MRILGIDPGLQRTGFGLIDADGATLRYVASGTIGTTEAPRGDLPARLKLIFDGVAEVIARWQPQAASVEALLAVAEDRPVVFPVHPRTAGRLDTFGLR